jgi:hypothetical protein
MLSRLRTTTTRQRLITYALVASRSRFRRTGKAACSTALAYSHDPEGTVLEFIDFTSYSGQS